MIDLKNILQIGILEGAFIITEEKTECTKFIALIDNINTSKKITVDHKEIKSIMDDYSCNTLWDEDLIYEYGNIKVYFLQA